MLDLVYPPSTAPLLKGCARARSSEMLPIVDENGVVYAQAPRQYCHNGVSKPLHPVVHLHIINREGEIYLQRRSERKDLLPLRWDTAVGGHVSLGEDVAQALRRETLEEIGISDFLPVPLPHYVFQSDVERELVFPHRTTFDGEIHPSTETDGGRFWSMDEISHAMGKGILTPNFEQEYKRLFS